MTYRDIITNAAQNAKLCSLTQQLPASLLQSGIIALKERLSQYSNSNLLEFSRQYVDFRYDKEVVSVGMYKLNEHYTEGENFFTDITPNELMNKPVMSVLYDYKNEPTKHYVKATETSVVDMPMDDEAKKRYFSYCPDVIVKDIETITRCYAKLKTEYINLKFVSYEDIDLFCKGSQVYTFIQRTNDVIDFKTKCSQTEYRVYYNEKFNMDELDEELDIPSKWVTLLTTALTVDFARMYPRISDSTYSILLARLEEMEHNIKTSSSVNKFIGRYNTSDLSIGYTAGLNGTFLL